MRQQLRLRLSRLSQLGPETYITIGVLVGAVLFIFAQLHPNLIFTNTTPAGGDMGAHVWGPAFMRDHLLPHFRLFGWAPSWYGGFPAFQFYFPLPSLAIVVLNLVMPYGIAFKIITILGVLALPVCAWAFGKMAGMRFPGPVILAIGTVPYLFDRGWTIYGGNIASTLAGEFSFSISLALALLFLGFVARGLDTGKHRATAAILLCATGLCHLLPTIFAVVGALVLLMLRPGKRRATYIAWILGLGALLVSFWAVPFYFRLPYANNMGWEKITQYMTNLFPHNIRWVVVLAAAGAIVSVAFRRRTGLFWFGMAAISAALFVLAPGGRLWNARVLPFWYLCLYMLAAVAVTEAGVAISQLFAADPQYPSPRLLRAAPLVTAFAAWMFVGLPLGALPSWLPKPKTTDHSFIPDWAKWNYSGYQEKAAYPEYKSIIDTMAEVGRDDGCGTAHWEYESDLDRFGTPMALMLLPFWTNGCINSEEGLYFESSATTPYHFLTAAELSKAPSDPQRDLPYTNVYDGTVHADRFNLGIQQEQLLGTKYYLAFSPETIALANANPSLHQIAQTGKWIVYEISGTEEVSPLKYQPAVVTGAGGRGERPWLDMGVDWYMNSTDFDVPLTANGPSSWQRVALHKVPTATTTIGSGVAVDTPSKQPLPDNTVSNIKSTDSGISFDVSRPGVPVLVKISYYPNWQAKGAEGPYRATPNEMIVIPTSTHVSLHYGYTPVDIFGYLLSLLGIVGIVFVIRRGPMDFDPMLLDTVPVAPATRREDGEGEPSRPAPAKREPVSARERGG